MKNIRHNRRSVSPFGALPPVQNPFEDLSNRIKEKLDLNESNFTHKQKLRDILDLPAVPLLIEKYMDAPAHDAPRLEELCLYVDRLQPDLETHGLRLEMHDWMLELFKRKTELFLVDHYDKEHCEKMEWPEKYRDVVLFAKERDTLVGAYFAKRAESTPGEFAEFMTQWAQSPTSDRQLHFLDFCYRLTQPTFDYVLLASLPPIQRWVRNKSFLQELLSQNDAILKKVKSPTWKTDTKKALKLI
jgi:hypothetical protein